MGHGTIIGFLFACKIARLSSTRNEGSTNRTIGAARRIAFMFIIGKQYEWNDLKTTQLHRVSNKYDEISDIEYRLQANVYSSSK